MPVSLRLRGRTARKDGTLLDGSITYVVVILWGAWALSGDRIKRESPAMILLSLVFAFYVSRLLAATLFPLPIDAAAIEQGQMRSDAGFGPGNNFRPFATVVDASRSEFTFLNQIVGNFFLLFPLGLLAPLLWSRFSNKMAAIALVIATTLAIEFTQLGVSGVLGFTYRSFDVDDLWLNAAGGILGALVATMLAKIAVPKSDETSTQVELGTEAEDEVLPTRSSSLRETVPCRSEP